MVLDYNNGVSSFYCERQFVSDSLHLLAFDKITGNIIDDKAYRLLSIQHPGNSDVSIIDFKNLTIIQYHQLASLFFCGTDSLLMPLWEYEDFEKEDFGYQCKKASARFLGRKWSVLYTEEIPLSTGPWLLWGAPGLILYARDEKGEFIFEFRYIEPYDGKNHREKVLKDYYETVHCRNRFSGSLKESELYYYRVVNNTELFCQISGMVSETMSTFTPIWSNTLIPYEYWLDK